MSRRSFALLFVSVLLLIGVVWALWSRKETAPLPGSLAVVQAPAASSGTTPAQQPERAPEVSGSAKGTALSEALVSLRLLLSRSEARPEEKLAVIYQLFRSLDKLSDQERRTLLRAFFASGEDLATGLPFEIGVGGWLRSFTSLRVALLDYIGRVDPALAGELREQVYSRSRSADEWALCLRDEARTSRSPEAIAQLENHLARYLSEPEWSRQPSVAYLEGFDVAVYLRRTDVIPLLSLLASASNPKATRFAAFLTLDHLMLAAPCETLQALSANTALLADETNVRAGLYARASLSDPRQQQLLEAYLSRNDISDTERRQFGELFPNYNTSSSVNLLSTNRSYPLAEMKAGDQLALEQLERWQASGAYPAWSAVFVRIQSRLKAFASGTAVSR